MIVAECVEVQNQTAIYRKYVEPKYRRVPRFSNGSYSLEIFESAPKVISINENQRKLISLSNKFDSIKILDEFKNNTNHRIYDTFNYIANSLISLNPEKIDLEFTSDNSLLFSFSKGDLVSFFEFYIDDSEVLFSAFKNNSKLNSYSGGVADSLNKIKSYL